MDYNKRKKIEISYGIANENVVVTTFPLEISHLF